MDFGLLPWHFGGEPTLSYGEIDAYLKAARDLADARRRQASAHRRR